MSNIFQKAISGIGHVASQASKTVSNVSNKAINAPGKVFDKTIGTVFKQGKQAIEGTTKQVATWTGHDKKDVPINATRSLSGNEWLSEIKRIVSMDTPQPTPIIPAPTNITPAISPWIIAGGIGLVVFGLVYFLRRKGEA
jgi:hypothetical protein